MRVPQKTAKLWYNFLQLAVQQGVPIDWSKYEGWGTKKEIAATSFNQWWKQRGRDLFNLPEAAAVEVELVERDASTITVRIPLAMRLDDTRKEISELVLKSRPKKRIGSVYKFKLSGQENYSTLAQYKRFLELDWDQRFQGKTVEERTLALVDYYERLEKKGKRQRATLRSRGKRSAANRFSNREASDFDRKKLGGISPKRVNRWRQSGKHIILNVAAGLFPGTDYYGNGLAERLRRKLSAAGLSDIGNVQHAKGGRKKKPKLKRSQGLTEHIDRSASQRH
jgi:hypothetical protein